VHVRGVVAGLCLVLLTSTIVFATVDTPLIAAIRAGKADVVRALLQKKVDVNATQGDGATALHWAVHLDDLATVDLLIKAGAKVNVSDDTGVSPLYLSCMNRHAALVERLLAAGANPNTALVNGETVLMMCARAGDPASVRALLVHGAQVNAKEKMHDQTALMWAASEKRPEVVKLLLETGADISLRSRTYPRTVTGEETQRAGREELNYTILRGGSTALLLSAREGDVESARLLLAAGANVNDTLPDGTTALIEAAHSGQGAVAALLLDKGADPNNADIGYSALHAAVLRGDLALVKGLLAHKANPNLVITKATQTKRANGHEFEMLAPMLGSTPYMLAAQYLEREMMRALAAAGADTRLPKKDGTTPLMLSVGMLASTSVDRRSHRTLDGAKVEDEVQVLEGVKTALSLGADINAVNQQGDTALHSAAAQGFNRVIQLLVESGASLSVRNKRGLTPLAVAVAASGPTRAVATGVDDADLPSSQQSTVDLLKKLGAE
jgi:ankyrin repeat protein